MKDERPKPTAGGAKKGKSKKKIPKRIQYTVPPDIPVVLEEVARGLANMEQNEDVWLVDTPPDLVGADDPPDAIPCQQLTSPVLCSAGALRIGPKDWSEPYRPHRRYLYSKVPEDGMAPCHPQNPGEPNDCPARCG